MRRLRKCKKKKIHLKLIKLLNHVQKSFFLLFGHRIMKLLKKKKTYNALTYFLLLPFLELYNLKLRNHIITFSKTKKKKKGETKPIWIQKKRKNVITSPLSFNAFSQYPHFLFLLIYNIGLHKNPKENNPTSIIKILCKNKIKTNSIHFCFIIFITKYKLFLTQQKINKKQKKLLRNFQCYIASCFF